MTPEQERRQDVRIVRNFMLSYYDKADSTQTVEVTQLKNISMGGICFITTKNIPLATKLAVEVTTPYLANITYFEGAVEGCQEKATDLLYETRIKFDTLNPKEKVVLTKLIEFCVDEEKGHHE